MNRQCDRHLRLNKRNWKRDVCVAGPRIVLRAGVVFLECYATQSVLRKTFPYLIGSSVIFSKFRALLKTGEAFVPSKNKFALAARKN